jgi:predicted AAA+ superfamily ATPase
MGVLIGCKPRKEVLKGDLQDAIFAADFGDLVADRAPAVYGDAKTFFQNTHPAKQLRKVVEVVFGRLADAKEAGATLRLSTGLGGGKTHTLMALWHLAHHVGDPAIGTELLPEGRPTEDRQVRGHRW